jgi:hypothetical protein
LEPFIIINVFHRLRSLQRKNRLWGIMAKPAFIAPVAFPFFELETWKILVGLHLTVLSLA